MQVGKVFRTWRRRRIAARQDAFVEAWKNAWSEGCHRRWQGGSQDEAPDVYDYQRAAWLAGWQWADAHPDRRQDSPPATDYRRSADRRARLARGTRRGIAGLTILAAARWWWRRRSAIRAGRVSEETLEPQSSPEPGDDLETS
jgi:hypothetical protein